MSTSLKLVFIPEAECNWPDDLQDKLGRHSVDIGSETNFTITKKFSALSNIKKIISDFSFSITATITEHLSYYLRFAPYKLDNEIRRYRAYVIENEIPIIDGFVCVNVSKVNLKTYRDTLTFQIIGTHQLWKDESKQLCIKQLDLGQFEWTGTNLWTLWQTYEEWDGTYDFYPFVANMGKWALPDVKLFGTLGFLNLPDLSDLFPNGQGVAASEITYGIYKLAIWTKAFCEFGYKIESKYLNSNRYKREIAYFFKQSKDDADSDLGFPAGTSPGDVKVVLIPNANPLIPIPGVLLPGDNQTPIRFSSGVDGTYNNGGHYKELLGIFTGVSGTFSFLLEMTLQSFWIPGQTNGSVIIRIVKEQSDGSITILAESNPIAAQRDIFLQSAQTVLTSDCKVYVVADSSHNIPSAPGSPLTLDFSSASNGAFIITGDFDNIITGDIVDISSNIDNAVKIFDFIEEEATLHNLEFETDIAKRIVYIEPGPQSYTTQEGETCDGFLRPRTHSSNFNITDKIRIDKDIQKVNDIKKKKGGYTFKFKKATDKKIIISNITDLYSNEVVFNNKDLARNKIQLKLYEPTITLEDDTIPRIDKTKRGANIPFLWENEPSKEAISSQTKNDKLPERGLNTGFRTLFVYGLRKQIIPGATIDYRTWSFEGMPDPFTDQTSIPTVAQCYREELENIITGLRYNDPRNIVFGDYFCKADLVNTVHLASIYKDFFGTNYKISVCMTAAELACFSQRSLAIIDSGRYSGEYKVDVMQRKSGPVGETNLEICLLNSVVCQSPIPEENVPETTADPCSDQRPFLTVMMVDDCCIFLIEGEYDFTIDSINWTWYYDDDPGTLFVPNVLGPLSAEVCAGTREFTIEANIVPIIDDDNICESKIISYSKNPCSNAPLLRYSTYKDNAGLECFEIIIDGTFQSSIDTVTFNLLDNGIPIIYNGGSYCGQNGTITGDITITYFGACEDTIVPVYLDLSPFIVNCDSTNASLEIIGTIPGCYTINRIGFVFATNVIDRIYWQPVNPAGDPIGELQLWDGTDICVPFRTFREITDCDQICKEYCSTFVYNDQCSCPDILADVTIDIDCDVNGNITYTVAHVGICTLPTITSVRWYKGIFLSGIANTFLFNGPTFAIKSEMDVRVEITFGNDCIVSSPVIDIPYAGDPTPLASLAT